tara:strand:+ start:276 stop:1001 length:726 start_codon:yes stop_codon:yes gene_type:complete
MNHSWIRLIAVSLFLLVVSPVQSGAGKWNPISEEDSLLTVKIGDLKTRYYGSGWNENYSMQHFIALAKADWVHGELGDRVRPFHLFARMTEIAKGYSWAGMSQNLLQRIEKTPSFKHRNVKVLDQFNINIKHARDTKHGLGQSLKFSADKSGAMRGPEICYMFLHMRGIDNAGLWGGCVDYCPALSFRICASKDLNLDMSEPPKYFRIDFKNEKVSLNLSHSNLGKKLLDLSNSTYNDLVR